MSKKTIEVEDESGAEYEKAVAEMEKRAIRETPWTPEEMLERALKYVKERATHWPIVQIDTTGKKVVTIREDGRLKSYKLSPEGQIVIDFKKGVILEGEWSDDKEPVRILPKTSAEMLEQALDLIKQMAAMQPIVQINITHDSIDTTRPEDKWKTRKSLPEGKIIIDFKKEAVREGEWRENEGGEPNDE